MIYTIRIPVVPVQHRPVRKSSLCDNEAAMLAALDLFHTISYLRQLQGLKQKPEKWTKAIHIPGVDPECITLKVNGRKVHLRALKETGDSENGETTEIRRTFALPENLNTEKLECKVSVNGVLKLEAPFKTEKRNEEKENSCETPAQTGNDQEILSLSTEKNIQHETETKSMPSVWKRRYCLKGFKTESLKVSVRDNIVTIEGEMKMSENDDASISMMKMISLPENVNVDNLWCHMTNEGTLELEAPFMNETVNTDESVEGELNSTTDDTNSHDQGDILNTSEDDTNSHHQEEVLNTTADDTNSHDQGEILNTSADYTNSHHQEEVLNTTADYTNSHYQGKILKTTADYTNSHHQEEVLNTTADDTNSHDQGKILKTTADDTNSHHQDEILNTTADDTNKHKEKKLNSKTDDTSTQTSSD